MTDPNKQVLKHFQTIARRSGFILNPDPDSLQQLLSQLILSREQTGQYCCPCKSQFHLNQENRINCPCPTFREEIGQWGYCRCRLFFSPAAAARFAQQPGLLTKITAPG